MASSNPIGSARPWRAWLAGLVLAWALPVASCAQTPPAVQTPSSQAILDYLNAIIRWYRQSQTGAQWILQPSDVFFWNTQKALAAQTVQAAFESAKAEAPLVPDSAPPKAVAAKSPSTSAQRLESQIALIAGKLSRVQGQLDAVGKQIASVPAGQADPVLVARKNALQAEVDLYGAERDSMSKLSAFFGGTEDAGGASLDGQIRALQRSVPEAFDNQSAGAKSEEIQPVNTSGGLISRASQLFGLVRSRHALDQLSQETAALQATANQLVVPLRASLRETIAKGQGAEAQLAGADSERLKALGVGLEGAANNFKEISAAVLPLRQETVLLDSSLNNLAQWRKSFDQQYDAIIRVLIGRAAAVLVAMGVLAAISEVWRRVTFRYVHDLRRRRQLLLVRRIATGVLMSVVIVMGFISDFSSLATFAGFITAGLAVALQAIVLSVAAYFFLIGRYGVRVGDRLTLGGVTGEVIDIGLVRVYMMELVGIGTVLHPTGRIAVFPNSALFQASPLYKQIPGTDYVWHQVSVALAPEADSAFAEERLLEAVNSIYGGYKSRLEHQHQMAERLIDLRLGTPGPSSHVQFTDEGLELIVRYPVETQRAAEIDDEVTKKMLEAIRKDPKLKQAIAGNPRIRLAA